MSIVPVIEFIETIFLIVMVLSISIPVLLLFRRYG